MSNQRDVSQNKDVQFIMEGLVYDIRLQGIVEDIVKQILESEVAKNVILGNKPKP